MSDLLPISLVAHTVFCPRRAWLEAQGETVVHFQIESGTDAHRAVDKPGTQRRLETRALEVSHGPLGLTGRCDVLVRGDQGLTVIEYKATPVRLRPEVTEAQRIQLTLQRMCLEDMGHVVAGQSVFFTDHQQLVDVVMSESLADLAIGYVKETRLLTEQARPPDPLRDSPRCRWCSHVSVCLPDEVSGRLPVRSIAVADPEGEVLHLTTPGSRASLKQGRVIVQRGEERLGSLPVDRVVGLVVHGNADVSSALLRELWWRGEAVVWCGFQGRVVAWSESANAPNGRARIRQNAQSEVGRLDVAREFVSAKIANQATQLRRNAASPVSETIAHLRVLQRMARAATSNPELLGLEGRAAHAYFSAFPLMLKGEVSWLTTEWPGRHGRNASDPLNALLNYAYGLLLADVIRAVTACGLDPVAGFLHSSGRNKPALALDLMEEFRAPLADSVILGALNNGEIRSTDLTEVLGVARLRDSGRKAVIAAYERRLEQRIRHPTFGYQVSWRRVIEVQARLLMATLEGTRDSYVGIRTR